MLVLRQKQKNVPIRYHLVENVGFFHFKSYSIVHCKPAKNLQATVAISGVSVLHVFTVHLV